MKRIIVKQFTLCLALFVTCLIAKAQTVSLYLTGDFQFDPGSTFTTDLQVDSFINVGGFGFSVNWDPNILQFKEVSNLGIDFSGQFSGFNDGGAMSEGELGVFWLNPLIPAGVTLSDSTRLMSLTFDVIGEPGDTTSIRFTSDPVAIDFSTGDLVVIPHEFEDEPVTLTGTSNTYYNSAPEIISLYPPTPNPFHENTMIKIDLRQAALTDIKIVDQTGKLLYQGQQFFSAGPQNIPISKEIFQQSGTYYCLLNADNFRIMQKLVFIDR